MSLAELNTIERRMIQEIIQSEVWLCAERRGHPVDAKDPEVQLRVCEIILQIGDQLRDRALNNL